MHIITYRCQSVIFIGAIILGNFVTLRVLMKVLFLSHTDSNLYLFRLPVMLALKSQGHEVIALIPKGEDFNKFAPLGILAIDYPINSLSFS